MASEPPIAAELGEQVPPAAQAALLAVLARYEQRLAELQAQEERGARLPASPSISP
jgi:hypothetical protein